MAQAKTKLTTDPGPRFDRCKYDAIKILDRAAIVWSQGDPSDPSTKDVLSDILALFAKERFLQPPNGAFGH